MSNRSRNVLRQRKKRKLSSKIIGYSVMFFIVLTVMVFVAYCYKNYIFLNGAKELDMMAIMTMLGTMFEFETFVLPFSFPLFIELLVIQVKDFWWVYLSTAAIIFIAVTSQRPNDYKNIEQGSANWSDDEDLKLFAKPDGIPCAKDFYVPLKDGNLAPNLNEIVIGGSGAGKSFRKIKPDILQMLGSYVVTDPSGELYRDTAKPLREHGYKVRVLNLVNPNLSNSYNPFAYMESEQDVVSICSLFMKNSAGDGEQEDFWAGAALDLLTAISIYLYKTDGETKSFGRVVRLVNSVRYKHGKVDPLCEIARCFEKHAITYPHDAATISWSGMLGSPEETMGSICKTLATRLRLWTVSDVDALTLDDEMDFDDLGIHKTVIFLIVPPARQTYKAVANIFYSQLFERLMRVAEARTDGKLPQLVSCELDEFANIGEIPSFCETLAVIRKYNIRACIVLQGLSQLKAIYEKTWESIIGNCSIFTFLGTTDNDTLEYVSKKLGNTTVRIDTKSYNRGNQSGGQDSESFISRPLLYPEEIKKAVRPRGKNKKYGGNCIVFVGYLEPFFLPKFDTLNHPRISLCGSAYKKDEHNNTYIADVYGPLYEKRKADYESHMDDFYTRLQNEEAELKQQEKEREQDEQKKLSNEWESFSVDNEFTGTLPEAEAADFDDEFSFSDLEDSYDYEIDVNPVLDKFNPEEVNKDV